MKITFNDALNFREFYTTVRDQKFPLRTGYRLNCLLKALEPHYSFYQEQLTSIIEENAEKDTNGNLIHNEDGNFKIPPEKIMECNEKINELLSFEIEIDAKPLNVSEIETLELPMDKIQGIIPFITE